MSFSRSAVYLGWTLHPVNVGFGDAWSAAELVEYTNGAVTAPMGKWRAANGHTRPYNVKLWGVGNEPWGDYQMGAMPVEQFEIKHNLFANARCTRSS